MEELKLYRYYPDINGKTSLCLRGEARKKNGCVATLIINRKMIPPEGCSFNIQGSGRICLRNRYTGSKWVYLDLNTMKTSKNANYSHFFQKEWKKITFRNDNSFNGNLELEIRTGKGEPFCLWIATKGAAKAHY